MQGDGVGFKSALVMGVTGQDGALLARLLHDKGYLVHGVRRWSSGVNTCNIDDLICRDSCQKETRFILHYGDITDSACVLKLLQRIKPIEVYNLAAQSHVGLSFEMPEYTSDVDALGPLRLLEAIRILGMGKRVRFVQASTSEMFGDFAPVPQSEVTPFSPSSPYAVSKLYAHWTVVNYRKAYKLHASNAIMFNHESPLRSELFVTRKITRAVAAISRGEQYVISLGNLNARRDWGHSRDYVEAMWRMAQRSEPDDYVICTGESHSVRDFVQASFAVINREIEWSGDGVNEVGRCVSSGATLVRVDPSLFRPIDPSHLCGDGGKARRMLNWEPRVNFSDLVREMVMADLKKGNS